MSTAAVYAQSTTISVTLESNDQAAADENDRRGEEMAAAAAASRALMDEEIGRESSDGGRERTGSVLQPPPITLADRAVGGAPQLPIAPSQEYLLRTGEDKQFLE